MARRGQATVVPHIDEQSLELYALGRLRSAELFKRIDSHVQLCPGCREQVTQLIHEAHMICEALSRLTPLFTHRTDDGDILATVRRVNARRYIARLVGPTLECGRMCRSAHYARAWCRRAFTEMFPEHKCSTSCTSAVDTNS